MSHGLSHAFEHHGGGSVNRVSKQPQGEPYLEGAREQGGELQRGGCGNSADTAERAAKLQIERHCVAGHRACAQPGGLERSYELLQARQSRAVAQQQHGKHRYRQAPQKGGQQLPVSLAGRADLQKHDQPKGREKVHRNQRDNDLHDHAGTDGCDGDSAPAHQTSADQAAADAGHRQQAVDRFAHIGDPEQIAEPGTMRWIGWANENEPAKGIEEKEHHAIGNQPQQPPAARMQGVKHR